MHITPIAYFRSPFVSKFGIPRQSGIIESLEGEVVFCPPYDNADAVRGIDGFTHLWLIWGFSENIRAKDDETQANVHLTVRPPRLGGNERIGVFASRSPFRPNGLGLSCVRLKEIGKGRLVVCGADLMDGTPIYDIKPYVPYADCMKEATGGYTDNAWRRLDVSFPQQLRTSMSDADVRTIIVALQQDPRPHYHNDDTRIYGMPYRNKDIKFCVKGNTVEVISVSEENIK
ncbi:MAG: tRNA (N6-threonylcarbamoyladenosine(37)-N6)-methyltransferase TrmO [Prevotella sp.]|nr:tRNA (N6-threonylcarbamoyladenosine(37)-N6)-methyltransferase TrmO [Prevotella sp.]